MKNTYEKSSYEKNLLMNNNTKWSKLSIEVCDNNLQTKEYPSKLSKRLLQGAKNIAFKTGSVFKRANDFIEEKSKKVEQKYLGDFLSSYVESKKLAAMTMLGIGLVFGSGVGKANAGSNVMSKGIHEMTPEEYSQYNYNKSMIDYYNKSEEERDESFRDYIVRGGSVVNQEGVKTKSAEETTVQKTQQRYNTPKVNKELIKRIEDIKGNYTIQILVIKKREQAEDLQKRLQKENYNPYIIEARLSKTNIWYRIRTGFFDTKEQAEKVLLDLKEKGYQPILVKK